MEKLLFRKVFIISRSGTLLWRAGESPQTFVKHNNKRAIDKIALYF